MCCSIFHITSSVCWDLYLQGRTAGWWKKAPFVIVTSLSRQQAGGQRRRRDTSLVLVTSFSPPAAAPPENTLYVQFSASKRIVGERKHRGTNVTQQSSCESRCFSGFTGLQTSRITTTRTDKDLDRTLSVLSYTVLKLCISIIYFPEPLFVVAPLHTSNKAANKQSTMKAGRFLQRAQDANEISHGLTVEEIELPRLLLEWRNASLMLWAEWRRGRRKRGESPVPPTTAPPTPPLWTLPDSDWAFSQAAFFSALSERSSCDEDSQVR